MVILINNLEQKVCTHLAEIDRKLDRLVTLEEKLDRMSNMADNQFTRSERVIQTVPARAGSQAALGRVKRQLSKQGPQGQEESDRPTLSRFDSSRSFLAVRAAVNVLGKNTKRGRLAEKMWLILEPEDGFGSRGWFVRTWPLLVMASVAFALLDEVRPASWSGTPAAAVEAAFDGLFTLEALVRFLVCPDRLAFFFDVLNHIDFAAGPLLLLLRISYLVMLNRDSVAQSADWSLALSCITPGLRLLKILRRFEKFHLLLSAFRMALEALPVLLYTLVLIVFFFSAGIYWFEPKDNIESFPRAMWFTVVTMSTVGYGDTVPHSVPGYLIVSVLVIISALYMAIPLGIVGSAFNRVWEDRDRLLLLHRMRTHLEQKGYDAMDIPELFFLFDEDRDGQLSFLEFHKMMVGLRLGISKDRAVRLFHAFDRDGSGGVDDAEFVRRLFPQAYLHIYGPAPAEAPGSPGSNSEGSSALATRRAAVTSVGAFRRQLPSAAVVSLPRGSEEEYSESPTGEQSQGHLAL